jgi:phosphoribosylcarboxyaminoimidazole (NCAIR) mutase
MNSTKTVMAAAVFGCCAGAVAALTSATAMPRSAPAVAVIGPVQSTDADRSADPIPQRVGTPSGIPKGAAPIQAGHAKAADAPILRARALSQKPDVQALVGIRRDVLQEARRRGVENTPETKQRLAEIDRALQDARLLRLKLDGEQLRKMRAKTP